MKGSYAILTLLLVAGCSGKTTPIGGGGGGGTGAMSFAQIGATGGWFPSIAFDPAHEGTVWASGDDGTGLYQSTDGGKDWTIVQTGAPNQATYSLRFDPNNPGTIYAPNHFGRGMLKSTNDGATWTASQAGLPISGQPSQALNDLAVDPTNSSSVYIATDNGLYHSTNGGASFTLTSTTLAGTAGVGAVAFNSSGVLFVGTEQGAFGYYSAGSWTQLLPPSGVAPPDVAIAAIVFSNTSIYLVYADALIYRLDKNTFSPTTINDPTQSGSIQNLERITLAVVSGSSATTDTVYVSTMGQATIPASQWGLFKSVNGGGAWSQLLTGNIMSVAVDPLNASNVIAGSGGGLGIYYSTNGGANFTLASTTNLYSTAGLALAQDPSNPLYVLASETACGGWGLDYESMDGGLSWTSFVDPILDDGILSFNFDPVNSGTIIAGTCSQGILRKTSGSWTTVATTAAQRVLRLARDKINPANVYAIVPSGDGNHNLYVSTNSGASFAPIAGVAALSVGVHPSNAGEAIVVTLTDALVTTNAFGSTISLGLAGLASNSNEGGLTAVAYNPSNPQEVLVGGASGGLYHTTNYSSSGTGVSWTKVSAPMIASGIQDVVIVNRGGRAVYYVIAVAGDTGVTATSTQGVFRSLDGVTWAAISGPLFPSSMPWRMIPDAAAPTSQFLIGMWSGGIYRLTDTQ